MIMSCNPSAYNLAGHEGGFAHMRDGQESQPDHDQFLVTGLRENDNVVIRSFMDRYLGPLIGFVMKMGIPRDDAEEIGSAAMVRVALTIGRFDPARAKFSTWIFGITKNRALDYLRRRKRQHTPSEQLDESLILASGDYDPDNLPESPAASCPLKILFLQAFNNLSEEDGTVLKLAAQEWTYAAIGQVLKKSEDAVKIQAFRARKRLREEIKKLGEEGSIDISEAEWEGLKHWKGQKEVEL